MLFVFGIGFTTLASEEIAPVVCDLPVTNGLIRWWPNLFDAHDEITGEEGAVVGILPRVDSNAEDTTEFGPRTGWVQLKPAITNEVFTLSFWMWWREWAACVIGQQSSETEWYFRAVLGIPGFFIDREIVDEGNYERIDLSLRQWHHVVITRRKDGTSAMFVDGAKRVEGKRSHPWPRDAGWLMVGNSLQGGIEGFRGRMFDLCVYDRTLSDAEVESLSGQGLRMRKARNSAARRRAEVTERAVEISTNVISVSAKNWTHRHFTTENGLPGTIVRAVLQAQNGYLWVGTEEGLARFDGKAFRSFTSENTPALKAIGQRVYSLSEDKEGSIWAGIFGGLLRIRNLEFTAFTNGLPQRFILQAEPAGDGSIWVAGFNAYLPRGPLTLRRYFPDAQSSSSEMTVPGHIRKLVVGGNGLWMATETPSRVCFWDEKSRAVSTVADFVMGLSDARVGGADLPAEARRRAWTGDGAEPNAWERIQLGEGRPDFYWFPDERYERVWAARWSGPVSSDEVWLGNYRSLARLRGDSLEKISFATDTGTVPEISCLSGNREGGIWFGTEEDGLHLLHEKLITVFTKSDGLAGNGVRSVSVGGDNALWVATDEGSSRLQDGMITKSKPAKLHSVTIDRGGRPWFSHEHFGRDAVTVGGVERNGTVDVGLDWQDPNTLRFGQDGTLWVVCERGVTWLKPELLKYKDECWKPEAGGAFGRYAVGAELPKIFPLGLIEDREGSIWLGSVAHGLFRLKDKRIDHFAGVEGLAGARCVPVHLDDSGAVWIVTDNGLSRFLNGRFKCISHEDGLPKDVLLDMIEDDLGNFWITGKRGIHRVVRRQMEDFCEGRSKSVRTLTLGARDGLLTPECSSYRYPTMAKTGDGHIWFGTRNGLATIDPRRVRFDAAPLPTTIETVLVNRKEISLGGLKAGDELKLPAGSGDRLEIRFTAVSLSAADLIRFRYRMNGADSDWSEPTDLRLAFYTNLKPGPYQFRVAAANAHGVWNEHETTLRFVVLPFFWQTNLFQVALGALVLLLALGWHWRRLTFQRRAQEMRLQQILLDEKTRIAADMHDQLGATLTQIAILGEVGKRQAGNAAQAESTLDRISQAARDVTAGMSELVWATNPRNDTLENLVAYLREQAAAQLQDTAIETMMNFPVDLPDHHVSATFRRNLLLILREILHNVIKHAQATKLSVALTVGNGELLLSVHDNGRGFESSGRQGGNGLANIRKRTSDLGGEFTLQSQPGQGTFIEIKAPLKSATDRSEISAR